MICLIRFVVSAVLASLYNAEPDIWFREDRSLRLFKINLSRKPLLRFEDTEISTRLSNLCGSVSGCLGEIAQAFPLILIRFRVYERKHRLLVGREIPCRTVETTRQVVFGRRCLTLTPSMLYFAARNAPTNAPPCYRESAAPGHGGC